MNKAFMGTQDQPTHKEEDLFAHEMMVGPRYIFLHRAPVLQIDQGHESSASGIVRTYFGAGSFCHTLYTP